MYNTCTFRFRVKYGSNFQNIVFSDKSTSKAALLYEQALNPSSKATISGPLLFGLQLSSVQKERESKRRGNLIKPAINYEIKLKTIEFSVNQIDYQINYGAKNWIEENNHIQSMIKAVDHGKTSRDSY
ncbi:hypothetical protein Glove_232g44 [Diversispora epigaea]|uniref:Uncharacterized protein n=1 Tax=Diversispora epigaea TaxID=1348612 RepID=A0A397IEE2_9GLOM|nr:hypothetical protein Glove_232g44 [Diversispora epigaea]